MSLDLFWTGEPVSRDRVVHVARAVTLYSCAVCGAGLPTGYRKGHDPGSLEVECSKCHTINSLVEVKWSGQH